MKKILTLIIGLITAANISFADTEPTGTTAGEFLKVGAAGAQFLKIGVGSRATALGGAYTSVAQDLTGIHWNPAGLAGVKSISGHFSYTQWFSDWEHNFAALATPVGEQFTFAAHWVSFGIDRIEHTTLHDGFRGTYYSVNDFAIGGTFAGYLTQDFSFGITGKYVTNSFSNLASQGFAFDIGTLYRTGIRGITLGFSIMNLGSSMEYSGPDLNDTKRPVEELNAMPLDVQYLTAPYSMPLIFRAGISAMVFDGGEHKVLASGDFVTFSDVPEQFALGAEYAWNDILYIRGGYTIGHDQLGLAGGIGLSYIGGGINGKVDYSISPMVDLGLINRISISLGLD